MQAIAVCDIQWLFATSWFLHFWAKANSLIPLAPWVAHWQPGVWLVECWLSRKLSVWKLTKCHHIFIRLNLNYTSGKRCWSNRIKPSRVDARPVLADVTKYISKHTVICCRIWVGCCYSPYSVTYKIETQEIQTIIVWTKYLFNSKRKEEHWCQARTWSCVVKNSLCPMYWKQKRYYIEQPKITFGLQGWSRDAPFQWCYGRSWGMGRPIGPKDA